MMVRIQGTGKSPVESRPFSEIAGSSWRPKRAANPSYPGNFYSPSNHAGVPLSVPINVRNENNGKKEEGPLSVFSPHQGKRNEVIGKEGSKVVSSPFSSSSSSSSSLPTAPPKPRKVTRDLYQLDWKPFSPELINYAFALLIFAIRYPSVFWHTNKRFAFLFSFFLILTGIQTIVVIVAFSILYKYQVNSSYLHSDYNEDFLSSPLSCLMICILSVLTLTISSSALYFYGYQRFATFLDKSRKRFHIMYSDTPLVLRPYTARLSALATFLCFCFSLGPLLWDFVILYRKSEGNKIVLTAIVSTIFYLSLWVVLWIILSIKSAWVFKLRVTVARAFVSSARSIKLVNDVEMTHNESENALAPILIVGSGRAVAIRDPVPKKTIMGLVNKIKEEKKLKGQEEEIYWLKPTFNSSFDRKRLAAKNQPKVTFNDSVEEKFSSRKKSLKDHSFSPTDDEYDEDEAGDYAILKDSYQSFRDNSEVSRSSDSEVSQQSPVLEDPRYVDRKQILAYQKEIKSSSSTDSSPVLVAPDYEETDHFDNTFPGPPTRHNIMMDTQGSVTPKSTRSNDSGVPLETPSHRSDSLSSDSSNSNTPPENSEESGVHSAALDIPRNSYKYLIASSDLPNLHPVPTFTVFICFSDEDLSQLPNDIHQPLLNRSNRYSANKPTAQTTAEATVAIRRQRNMTQEIRPPADPIYGTRKITSFSPPESHSPVPSPVPPMPPLPSLEETGVVGLFPPRHTPGHSRVSFQQPENPYGQRMSQTHSKYQQMPLPPIPQGMMPPPSMELLHSNTYGNIESSQHQQPLSYQQRGSNGVYGYTRNVAVGRSSSLRYPSTHVGIPKQYTNTLPHVLPKESQYNTNV
ncbi:Protein tincar [Armadillidium vulgare]|nr:Protein tincar [Armadillidium vulgare]